MMSFPLLAPKLRLSKSAFDAAQAAKGTGPDEALRMEATAPGGRWARSHPIASTVASKQFSTHVRC